MGWLSDFADDVLGFDPNGGGLHNVPILSDVMDNPVASTIMKFTPAAPLSYAWDAGSALGKGNYVGAGLNALGGYGSIGGFDGTFAGDLFNGAQNVGGNLFDSFSSGLGDLSSIFSGGDLSSLFSGGSMPTSLGSFASDATSLGSSGLGTLAEGASLGTGITPTSMSLSAPMAAGGELGAYTSAIPANINTGAGMTDFLGSGVSYPGASTGAMGGLGNGITSIPGVSGVGMPNLGASSLGSGLSFGDASQAAPYSQGILSSLFDYAKENPLKTLKAAGTLFGTGESAKNRQMLMDQYNKQQYFQDQLRRSYEDPNAYLASPEARAIRSSAAQQLARAAAQSGRRSDVGGQLRDLNQMMLSKALPQYRQGLTQAYNPQIAGQLLAAARGSSPTGTAMSGLANLFS